MVHLVNPSRIPIATIKGIRREKSATRCQLPHDQRAWLKGCRQRSRRTGESTHRTIAARTDGDREREPVRGPARGPHGEPEPWNVWGTNPGGWGNNQQCTHGTYAINKKGGRAAPPTYLGGNPFDVVKHRTSSGGYGHPVVYSTPPVCAFRAGLPRPANGTQSLKACDLGRSRTTNHPSNVNAASNGAARGQQCRNADQWRGTGPIGGTRPLFMNEKAETAPNDLSRP